jgi:uncharacterized membrane protein YeaQ/YmgE (transglycosylase-associated protein family)
VPWLQWPAILNNGEARFLQSALPKKEIAMLLILCIVVGSAIGFAMRLLVDKSLPLGPHVIIGVGGAMFGGFLLQLLDRSHEVRLQSLLASFIGAVAALLLARSLRQPMGVD